ncbi:single-strand binding protein [Thermocrinis albus DSM 14484]|uniref:Single-stranded DNA-binding protein n=1 Tax=Thermocrinis albus (strain DSM 14484 / JCM 11386 / HI 11/12) TaxID=638303 RepID=D3SNS2_THEAH|nr:single-stranded DNA-binding protein [Thermocrinis albus]ADC88809.1 single-strand binding protein [Thermocrinis albus DSM 14484]
MLNKVIIIGTLVRDPQIRYLPSGTQLLEFSIVWSRRYQVEDQVREESHFFDVKAYGKLAEKLSVKLFKGYTVVVEGRLAQEKWQDKEGNPRSKVRIVAETVRILRKPRIEGPVEEESVPEEDMAGTDTPFMSQDDEIPF